MSNYFEGALAEREFIELRSDTFVRSATKEENIHEHWDILDRELGRVDVKTPNSPLYCCVQRFRRSSIMSLHSYQINFS